MGEDDIGMSCREFVALITEYLEGTLPEETAARVRRHLDLCDPCEEYLRQMRRTIDALGQVPVETLSAQARTDILTAFRDYHSAG